MSREPPHLGEEIQDLLDGRLDTAARSRAEAHLEACDACQREWRALRAVKEAAQSVAKEHDVPADLASRVVAALDREDQDAARALTPAPGAVGKGRRVLFYGLLAACLALVVFFLAGRPDLPSSAARDSIAYRAGRLPLDLSTENHQELERFFAAHGISFRTRVLDLAMMNYRLVGGRVQKLAGRPSALFVYRGEGNKLLICQMYEGDVKELPDGAERREHDGIEFLLYRKEGETLVFWQEGNVTCVLASDIPSEEVIALAFAKAMKV